jgi:hypothetical protein
MHEHQLLNGAVRGNDGWCNGENNSHSLGPPHPYERERLAWKDLTPRHRAEAAVFDCAGCP